MVQEIYVTDKYAYTGSNQVKEYLKKGARLKAPEGFIISLQDEKDTYLNLRQSLSQSLKRIEDMECR